VTVTSAPPTVGVVPIDPGGPYDSPLSRGAAYLPSKVTAVLVEAGGISQLIVTVLWDAIRHPRGYWADTVEEMSFTVKRSYIAIVLALAGFLLMLSVPSQKFLNLAGVDELYGPLLLVQSTRTFTVWVATLLVAGVVGASMTAELGSRKVREELDAMEVMGIDPIRTLVLPRMVSVTIVTTLLAIPAELITIGSTIFSAQFIGGISPSNSLQFQFDTMSPVEIVALIINCFLAGLLIGISFVSLFVMQLGYNALVLGFFPGLGEFR
jgi:phospholipid/cholesterol/gamma-HCH transport system permease protein